MATPTAGVAGPLDRAAFRAFVDAEVLPRAARFDATECVPRDVLDKAAAVAAWAALIPAGAGGADLDMRSLAVQHEEVGRGCSSLRSLLTVHSMVSWAVVRWGGEPQLSRWLPVLADGSVLGAFCLTESQAGSDAAAITTSASRGGGDWVLDGRKMWITGGQVAGLFLVFARTGAGMAAFLVPRDAPGLRITPVGSLLGTRASMVAHLDFEDCRIPGDALLGPDGFALHTVLPGTLDIGRLSVAAGCVGILQACLDASVSYSAGRRQGGTELSEHQLVRRMVTDMATSAAAARLLCERAASLRDSGDPEATTATFMAKYFASTAASRAASDAVQIHGAAGCAPDATVARLYRDAKVMEIIEGSSEVQQVYIADAIYRGRQK
ncbi:acyl-CoA dehydrogenase family protein [Actinophytocola sp.]|uniref:acyl-CoA dehydrogenase family protein n=1 Tax=Actinophytocola sp. TaxID=1872138 RepID=UPI003899FF1A